METPALALDTLSASNVDKPFFPEEEGHHTHRYEGDEGAAEDVAGVRRDSGAGDASEGVDAEPAEIPRRPSVAQSTADEDLDLSACPADEETIETFKVLMQHKGFLLNAERDIAMLKVTSRELQDFVDRADDYKDEYFDIGQFATKIGSVWQERRPASSASLLNTVKSGDESPSTPSRNRIARIFPNRSAILATSSEKNAADAEKLKAQDLQLQKEQGKTVDTSVYNDSVSGLVQQRQPGMARRIAQNEERRKLFEAAMKGRAEELAAEERVNHSILTGDARQSINMTATTVNTTSAMLQKAAMNASDPTLARHSLRVAASSSPHSSVGGRAQYSAAASSAADGDVTTGRPFSRGGIATTPMNLTTVSLPPLMSAMTGGGGTLGKGSAAHAPPTNNSSIAFGSMSRASALPAHLKTSADGSRVLEQKRPDVLSALNLTPTRESQNSVLPSGLNKSDYGNLSALQTLTKAAGGDAIDLAAFGGHGKGARTDGSRCAAGARPFASDLVEPALSSFTPEAYYSGVSTHPAHNRAPEVERMAKLIQQQARERKLAAEKARALEAFGDEAEAALAENFGIQSVRDKSDSQQGKYVGGVLIPKSSADAKNSKATGGGKPFPLLKGELGKLLAEQEQGLAEQERKHADEYAPMLQRYYEYHDFAQQKLEKIAQMTGMAGAYAKGMGIPPKPAEEDGESIDV